MSGKDCCSKISIVGGSYREICYWPDWKYLFGSGWRAVRVFRAFSPNTEISFYSVGDEQLQRMMKVFANSEQLKPFITPSDSTIGFAYSHPLSSPVIIGGLANQLSLEADGKHVIGFGMLEALVKITGEYVVYDPQSPTHPLSFKQQGGKAVHLALVMNETEAKALSGESELHAIRDSLFEREKCDCLVIKRGAKGATVFHSIDDEGTSIPVFKTTHVWPIGSGDVFTIVFAYHWFNGYSPEESAMKASKAVAAYCESLGSYEELSQHLKDVFPEHKPRKQGNVYLAGPFFTMNEKRFVTECRNILKAMGVTVFSPYHDVGEGEAEDVVPKDIEAIDVCDCVFAIVDGLDSGTLFEIGYAVAKGKKVVVYVENETEGTLKMLKGTGCEIESDFTTAVYKTIWNATE